MISKKFNFAELDMQQLKKKEIFIKIANKHQRRTIFLMFGAFYVSLKIEKQLFRLNNCHFKDYDNKFEQDNFCIFVKQLRGKT